MDKRTLQTILITAAIVFLWQYFFMQPYYEQQKQQEQQDQQAQPVADEADSSPEGIIAAAAPADAVPAVVSDSGAALAAAVEPFSWTSTTTDVTVQWNNRNGGVLERVALPAFTMTTDTTAPVELIPDGSRSRALLATWGAEIMPRAARPVAVSDSQLVYVLYPYGEEQGLEVMATLAPTGPYEYRLTYRLANKNSQPIDLQQLSLGEAGGGQKGSFALGWGPTLGDSLPDRAGLNQLRVFYRLGADDVEEASASRYGGFLSALFGGGKEEPQAEKSETINGEIGWAALSNRYFLAAVVPDEPGSAIQITEKGHDYGFSLIMPEISLAPNESQSYQYRLYLGPKDHTRLEAFGEKLEETISFGWFKTLGVFLLWMLKKFYGVIPNFGVAIILVTIVVRLIMYPLTYKSYESMKKMQSLQPRIEEIKKKFPKTPDRQQEEIMKLYRTEKINPLMGCLPMLLQLPIFIALFRMLEFAVELRHQPFIFWITDLSEPDVLGIFPDWIPLFGGAAINILPVLMGLTMFIQQKKGMTGANPQQERIMLFMPVMLMFMLYNFPAGLMLYWTMSNLFGLFQQWMISKKMPAPAAAAAPRRKK